MDWISEYRKAMEDGGVTVGHWIREWYGIVAKGIVEGKWRFCEEKAQRAIDYVERYCRHHEGALAPGLIKLELWQKALVSVIFGVLDADDRRQFREVMVVIGRKNGKTLLAAAIANYMAVVDGEYGARIYFCAPKLDQARLCYDAFYQMVLKEETTRKRCEKRRTDVYFPKSNTSVMPLAFSAKKSDGLNPHLTVCDEVAAWQGDPGLKQYEVLKSALGARRQPMILSISTAGYLDDGIYDELMKRATAVIQGTSGESRLAPFLYIIDDEAKWEDMDELRKANPNLGVSVSEDYMREEIAVAQNSLSKKVEFLTKYCNVKQNSSLAWLSKADIRKSFHIGTEEEPVPGSWRAQMMAEGKITAEGNRLSLEDFGRCYAVGGIDLSQTVDITACSVVIEREGIAYYFVQFFLPAEKLADATARDGIPYQKYIEKGWLKLSGENFVNYDDCFAWYVELLQKYKIYVLKIGLDRYCAQYLQAKLEAKAFHCDTVFQGTNLTGVINTTEGMVKDGTLQCADGNDLMKIHWMDAALKLSPERNLRQLVKISKNAHVDGVACLLDAMCMRENVWEVYGGRLVNKSRAL